MAITPAGSSPVSGSTAIDDSNFTAVSWSGTVGESTPGGTRLKEFQQDVLVQGQRYQHNTAAQADGKLGHQTDAAIKGLQSDLAAAGLYQGPINGQFDPDLAQAVKSLKGVTSLPNITSSAVAARLALIGGPAAAQTSSPSPSAPAAFKPKAASASVAHSTSDFTPKSAAPDPMLINAGRARSDPKEATEIDAAVIALSPAGNAHSESIEEYQKAIAAAAENGERDPNLVTALATLSHGKLKLGSQAEAVQLMQDTHDVLMAQALHKQPIMPNSVAAP